ncbi:MAG: sensor histidine kinase [Gammaproteobacteria bacterium]|nr:MAG: sensor histidine kinase [Gammaproteobacteria bacterium]
MLYARPTHLTQDFSRAFWRVASSLRASAQDALRHSRNNLPAIAALGCFGFPLYYVIWRILFPQDYEDLTLRLIGSALLAPLMFVRYWPTWAERHLTLYFWLAMTYCLPFFFTYMLLQNAEYSYASGEQTIVWQMSMVVALALLVMLINDGLLAGITFVVGSAAAWALFLAGSEGVKLALIGRDYLAPMPVYLFILVGGSIYNHHRDTVQQEMLRAVSSVGSNIAHELRTPLLGIKSDARGLQRYLPHLIEGYERAAEAGLDVRSIRRSHLATLHDSLTRIENETDFANTIIDMLLINSSGTQLDPKDFSSHSARDCIDSAMNRFPFASERERALIHVIPGPDFHFRGSDILLIHVLFNLLKNALYYVAAAGKGEIFIWTEANPGGRNRLFFMDTGAGIPDSVLPRIFDRFFTSANAGRGSGIGLSFCKMVMTAIGGEIRCESAHGEFTRFILTFPGDEDDD